MSVFAEPLATLRRIVANVPFDPAEGLAALDLIEQRAEEMLADPVSWREQTFRLRMEEAEQRATDMEKALRPFVKTGYPRVGIIGRFEVVDVRVNKSEYDAAVAALSAREEAQ